MNRPPKVLMAGHCHGVFLRPLCAQIQKYTPVQISVLELLEPGAEKRGGAGIAGTILVDPCPDITGMKEKAKGILWALSAKSPIWWGRRLGKIWSKPWRSCRRDVGVAYWSMLYQRELENVIAGFDLYHLHYLTPKLTALVRCVPAQGKIVLTTWGSDVLRPGGLQEFREQIEIAERATVITVRSLEMREFFLTRFGRHLLPKIRMAKMGDECIEWIDKAIGAEVRDTMRSKLGIQDGMIGITIGHNGYRANQHVAAIESIGRCSIEVRNRLAVVVPFGYGGDEKYRREILRAAEQVGVGVQFIEFLTPQELAQYRVAIDVHIQVPVSDALSASMCSALYAGTPVISGAWLPYGELRRRQVPLYEVRSVGEVGEKLEKVLDGFETARRATAGARKQVREVVGWDNIGSQWGTVYRELLE